MGGLRLGPELFADEPLATTVEPNEGPELTVPFICIRISVAVAPDPPTLRSQRGDLRVVDLARAHVDRRRQDHREEPGVVVAISGRLRGNGDGVREWELVSIRNIIASASRQQRKTR